MMMRLKVLCTALLLVLVELPLRLSCAGRIRADNGIDHPFMFRAFHGSKTQPREYIPLAPLLLSGPFTLHETARMHYMTRSTPQGSCSTGRSSPVCWYIVACCMMSLRSLLQFRRFPTRLRVALELVLNCSRKGCRGSSSGSRSCAY